MAKKSPDRRKRPRGPRYVGTAVNHRQANVRRVYIAVGRSWPVEDSGQIGSKVPSRLKEPMVTEQQAYLAMFAFLEARYQRGPSDALGTLLGSLSLLPDGSPADAALAEDWRNACVAACGGRVDAAMHLK